jgi:YVTN family beta-propeller protein
VGSDDSVDTVNGKVVVANSGNFSAQDGSLTLYTPSTKNTADADLDVAFINSLTLHDGRLFVLDNTQSDNAGRITTFNASRTLDFIALDPIDQTQNPRPPRFIAFPSDAKAYVTNLSRFDDNFNPKPSTVSVVDRADNTVEARVDVGRSPEDIAVTAGKAFVANSADGTLSVLNTDTDAVTSTVDLKCVKPKQVFVDGENEVAVVCKGQVGTDAEVLFLDPSDNSIQTRVSLGAPVASANATQSAFFSAQAEELYAVSGGAFGSGTGEIFRVNTDANALATTLSVPDNDDLIGISAVGYDATSQNLYVARLPVNASGGPSYRANGTALVLNRKGTVTAQFETGNAPGFITFLTDAR